MDVEAEILDAFGEAVEDASGVELIKVVSAQLNIAGLVFDDVVDSHGQGVGDGYERLLLAAAGSDAATLGSEVGVLLAHGSLGCFDQCGTQGAVAFAGSAAAPLASALVLAGA